MEKEKPKIEIYRCGRWMCDRLAEPNEKVPIEMLNNDGRPHVSGLCSECHHQKVIEILDRLSKQDN